MLSAGLGEAVHKQRAELTFKHNSVLGRHGWLRLTPAYSVRVVDGILARYPTAGKVIDPFSGTATTPLCAATCGHDAVAFDINPFLVWFGNVKLARYESSSVQQVEKAGTLMFDTATAESSPHVSPPAISSIERWWSERALWLLCRLMKTVQDWQPLTEAARDLLRVAFCRTMIGLSNAAFNHQSMSFKDETPASQQTLFHCNWREDFRRQFLADVQIVAEGARLNPGARARVVPADSRDLPTEAADGAELLITSPPYPNRMSYIRELRPYMYWLGFLDDKRGAGELDWRAIGGTWGIATSRVASWQRDSAGFLPHYLPKLLEQIRNADARSGDVLSRYVGRYFEDIWTHLCSAIRVVRPGASLHYIVGNSKFYDVVIPTERIYRDMLLEAGASNVEMTPIRKRNSKKELIEFDVTAQTPS